MTSICAYNRRQRFSRRFIQEDERRDIDLALRDFPAAQYELMFAFAGLKRILLADAATARARAPATPSSNNEAPPDWLSRPRRWLENRRARQRLWRCALLDPRFAKDIGLSELDIASECNTPFWVPVRRTRSPAKSISDRAEPE